MLLLALECACACAAAWVVIAGPRFPGGPTFLVLTLRLPPAHVFVVPLCRSCLTTVSFVLACPSSCLALCSRRSALWKAAAARSPCASSCEFSCHVWKNHDMALAVPPRLLSSGKRLFCAFLLDLLFSFLLFSSLPLALVAHSGRGQTNLSPSLLLLSPPSQTSACNHASAHTHALILTAVFPRPLFL